MSTDEHFLHETTQDEPNAEKGYVKNEVTCEKNGLLCHNEVFVHLKHLFERCLYARELISVELIRFVCATHRAPYDAENKVITKWWNAVENPSTQQRGCRYEKTRDKPRVDKGYVKNQVT
ncbi:hypothetical protein PBY51_013621 [Eleginops maclovinus]|uniref:Uncharacterized protein n=1 Tax=Eleginops maclovinus TaxID=56733 RepID=A0AAN8AX61_ELEMC|nr:hypothetical protein PBY51_013621 [Eleginops maclovinus]